MQSAQSGMITRLLGVRAFFAKHDDRLGDIARSGTRRQLDAILAELEQSATTQSGAPGDQKRGGLQFKRLRRVLVRKHMTLIARVAAADLPSSPALAPLRLPGRSTVAQLVAAARSMAKTAEPHAAIFVAAGLPEDFIHRLLSAADELSQFDGQRKQQRGEGVAATKSLAMRINAANRVIGVLDAMIQGAFEDDPAFLAEWSSVRRVRKLPRKPAGEPVPIPQVDGSVTPVVPITPSLAKSA